MPNADLRLNQITEKDTGKVFQLENATPTFDSVAAMKSATWLTVGQSARTLGYYTPGDGGGNDYEIVAADTGTDDGGSFIDLTGSGLQAKGLFSNGEIGLRRFGVTESSTSFRDAIESAANKAESLGIQHIHADVPEIVLSATCDFKSRTLVGNGVVLKADQNIFFRNLKSTVGVFTEADENRHISRPMQPAGSAITPGGKKVVFERDGRVYVITKGGGSRGGLLHEIVKGNVAAPSLPGGSLNENWEAWRTLSVFSLYEAFVYKKPNSVSAGADVFTLSRNLLSVEGTVPVEVGDWWSVDGSTLTDTGHEAVFTLQAGIDGIINIGFQTTATSGEAEIYIDGTLVETKDVRQSDSMLYIHEVKTLPGAHEVKVVKAGTGGVRVVGGNLQLFSLASLNDRMNYDSVGVYTESPFYTNNEGSNDYAIRDSDSGLLGGSYHGGETAVIPAEWRLDAASASPAKAGYIKICEHFSLFQRTLIKWENSSLQLNSSLRFGVGQVQQSFACDGTIAAKTFYAGMIGTSTAFKTLLGANYVDDVTLQDRLTSGNTVRIEQINRDSGRKVISEFTDFGFTNNPNDGAAAFLSMASIYNKIRYAPIQFSDVEVVNPSWVMTRTFD